MSGMVEVNKVENLDFKWGKKRGVGGKKKEVQFYESFTYDGMEYTLNDCVYMHKEGELDPYIGKMVKIWESSDKSKKVKVQWFFRPIEILNWLGDEKALENEIFLASGEGVGLANVNPLEAISGKCNVVCISKDSRNPQPSEEELKMADYIFYRTFDVEHHTISDKMDDKVGGVEIKFIFNRQQSGNACGIPKQGSNWKEDSQNAITCNETLLLSKQDPPAEFKPMKTDGNHNHLVGNRDADVTDLSVKRDSLPGVVKDLSVTFESLPQGKPSSGAVVEWKEDSRNAIWKEGSQNALACNETLWHSEQNPHEEFKNVKTNGSHNHLVGNRDAGVKDLSVKRESLPGVIKDKSVTQKSLPGGKRASGAVVDWKEDSQNAVACKETLRLSNQNPPEAFKTVKTDRNHNQLVGNESGKSTTGCRVDSDKDEVKVSKVPVKQGKESDALDDRPSKKARVDNSCKFIEDKNVNSTEKLPVHGNDAMALVITESATFSGGKTKSGHGKDSLRLDKGVKSAKETSDSEGRLSKVARVDSSLKLSEDKNRDIVQKLSMNSNGNDAKELVSTVMSSEERTKSRLSMDSLGPNKGPPKKEKPDRKTSTLSNGKLPKVAASESAQEDRETDGQAFEVTRRPDADKSKWFRALPWEGRLRSAHEQGTLVLLHNLNPEYTSGEVEDIIWHAFKEYSTARMVQHTAISSPHSGQAFVIFKTREAAERVIRKLDERCLMLPNGRPLVGSAGPPPSSPGKQSTFAGHLIIDKIKLQMQREMKDAVSTSHCSQPNTIEYEMAMEWCLLQSRSDSWWKKLYKRQGEDLRKLKANLKSK